MSSSSAAATAAAVTSAAPQAPTPGASIRDLPEFALERYFAKYEFTAPYIACASDVQALSLQELLAMADDECRALWDNLLLMYTESQGLPLLREQIIHQLYPSLRADMVNVLCPQEGIFLSMNALLQPSDHVIAVGPAYQSLTAVAEAVGCEVSLWRCREDPGDPTQGLVFDVADLETLVRPTTKLLVVNFPHNPTGFLPTQDEWQSIIAFCRQHDLHLFSDEMYHGLESDSNRQLPPACTLYDKAVTLSGMSKTYGMPGVRLGWVVSQDRAYLDRVARLKDYTTICNTGPSEILSLIALRNRPRVVARSLEIIRRNTALVEAFMARHRDVFAFRAPVAGPIAFPKYLPGDVASYAEALVQRSGILLLPGDKYGDPAYSDRFRLSLGRTNLPEILERWEKQLGAE